MDPTSTWPGTCLPDCVRLQRISPHRTGECSLLQYRDRAGQPWSRLDPDTVLDRRLEDAMLSIGHFARHGRVSVRMLRHYDAIGLLQPAYVDRVTGYRSYEAK